MYAECTVAVLMTGDNIGDIHLESWKKNQLEEFEFFQVHSSSTSWGELRETQETWEKVFISYKQVETITLGHLKHLTKEQKYLHP